VSPVNAAVASGAASLLLLVAAGQAVPATEPACASDSRPELLRSLDGRWVMQGDVMGKPVTYTLQVAPTLGCAFTELHMRDVQVPSEYEARVFIGADPSAKTVVVHWLDSFGGAASIPHGTGTLADKTLEFVVPYPSGAFRDRLVRDQARGTWSFVIESQQADGSWQHFARYSLRRP